MWSIFKRLNASKSYFYLTISLVVSVVKIAKVRKVMLKYSINIWHKYI